MNRFHKKKIVRKQTENRLTSGSRNRQSLLPLIDKYQGQHERTNSKNSKKSQKKIKATYQPNEDEAAQGFIISRCQSSLNNKPKNYQKQIGIKRQKQDSISRANIQRKLDFSNKAQVLQYTSPYANKYNQNMAVNKIAETFDIMMQNSIIKR